MTSTVFKEVNIPTLTPMMQQYLSIKAENTDCLLFFRLGDFYELFFEDAKLAAPILDVVLTQRGKHIGQEIPMCGVPAHSYEPYVAKLLKAGHKVAICEQLETPEVAKKRGPKAVVKREIVRILTPGTVIEEHLLDPSTSQNLVTLYVEGKNAFLVCADITTGQVLLQKSQVTSLSNDLLRLAPLELMIPDKLYATSIIKDQLQQYKSIISFRADNTFSLIRCANRVKDYYKLNKLELEEGEIIVLGALIEYIIYTHKNKIPHLRHPKKITPHHYLEIDFSTRKNLELLTSTDGNPKKSLRSVIDNTLTAMGSRLFAHYLTFPLANPAAISRRLDNIECLLKLPNLHENLREQLKLIPDIERLLSRVHTRRISFQDLILLREGLKNALGIADFLRKVGSQLSDNLKIVLNQIGSFTDVIEYLTKALVNNPLNKRYIKAGFSHKLDGYYNLKNNSDTAIEELRQKYKSQTNIPTLKINFNNMLGYFIEVSVGQISKMEGKEFILKQSMVNASRYTTPELQQLEKNILECDQNINALELQIYEEICNKISSSAENIFTIANAIAVLDVSCALGQLAIKNNYVRPIIDDSKAFVIKGGCHPVVEYFLKDKFVPNSCIMTQEKNIWLITGPNMAGKSTFLRQNAIIIIMAQMGSFVPAQEVHIGVVDKLFSRIGAADDIASGHSTFMIEMIETANILNNATSKSFLILDEVGRGTSTKDGLAIARAILENIHDSLKARTLFATHYHELTDLENVMSSLVCYTISVKEWEKKVIFLHTFIKGKADKSYGVHVAELAGLPKSVIERAYELQNQDYVPQQSTSEAQHWLEDSIKSIDLDSLTPKAAIDIIYNLRSKL